MRKSGGCPRSEKNFRWIFIVNPTISSDDHHSKWHLHIRMCDISSDCYIKYRFSEQILLYVFRELEKLSVLAFIGFPSIGFSSFDCTSISMLNACIVYDPNE